MGAETLIEWADSTFNAWVGCTKVSPACDHCYAEGWAKRTGHPELWQGQRRRTSSANWQQPRKWNRAAEEAARRPRVFCSSLADVFDNQIPERWRDDLWHLIDQTPHLDWLLLTKRPQNIAKMLPTTAIGAPAWGDGWPNVWLGTTVESQAEADRRIPHLLAVPARVRFLSCEPLLEPVDLGGEWGAYQDGNNSPRRKSWLDGLSWVIAGGESGGGARPMHPAWVRSLRDQCTAAGVPFLFKQWGDWAPHEVKAGGDLGGDVRRGRVAIVHPSGRSDVEVFTASGGRNTEPGSRYMARVGKAAAGRLLDGRTWDEFPP